MTKKVAQLMAVLVAGLLLFSDRFFKHLAFQSPETTRYLVDPWLGWEYFENTGIAFGIPIPLIATIIITPILLGLFFYTYKQQQSLSTTHYLSLTLLVGGALSNFFDRLAYGFVIDYLRIITSVINIADVMVVVAILLFLFEDRRTM